MFPSFLDADTLRDPFGAFSPFYKSGLMRDAAAFWPHGATQSFAEVRKLQLDLFGTMLTLWLMPLSLVHGAPDAALERTTAVPEPAPAPQAGETVALPPAPSPAAAAGALAAAALPTFLTAPEGEPDDLQRIIGIGPKLQRALNGLGIWHFRQIAALAPEEAAWVNDRIGFKGRIEREGWQAQASRLAKASRPPQAA